MTRSTSVPGRAPQIDVPVQTPDAPINHFTEEGAPKQRAYAKLQGANGLVHYMKGFSMTLGRGPGVDMVVSDDLAISRVHVSIGYSVEEQAFELIVLGKNGAFVNGAFVRRDSPPVVLASQTEITVGKNNPASLIFLLPCAKKPRATKTMTTQTRTLLHKIGHVIAKSDKRRLTAGDIVKELRAQHPSFSRAIGPDGVLSSAVRHEITTNLHLFTTHSTEELEMSVHAPDIEYHKMMTPGEKLPAQYQKVPTARMQEALFSVKDNHVSRFTSEEGEHGLISSFSSQPEE